jgi:glycine hydroxymethyltransferase
VPEFKTYQAEVLANARVMSDEMAARGWRIVAGGTDNHLFMVDVSAKMTGAKAQDALRDARIFVNRNLIPYDTASPMVTSGLRIGTPSMTARGLGADHFREVARIVDDVLRGDTATVPARIAALCEIAP